MVITYNSVLLQHHCWGNEAIHSAHWNGVLYNAWVLQRKRCPLWLIGEVCGLETTTSINAELYNRVLENWFSKPDNPFNVYGVHAVYIAIDGGYSFSGLYGYTADSVELDSSNYQMYWCSPERKCCLLSSKRLLSLALVQQYFYFLETQEELQVMVPII